MASNCVQNRVSIYNNACAVRNPYSNPPVIGGSTPAGFTPIVTLTPNRVVNTGQTVTIDGHVLPVLCLQFWDINLALTGGQQYWLSAFGLGTGNVGQFAYFLYNADCRRTCLIKWNQGAIYGPLVNQVNWVPGSVVSGAPHDHSFLIAIDDGNSPHALPGPGNAACAADFNADGRVSVDDVFSYLHAWFAGCP